jgi:hypothetical protein
MGNLRKVCTTLVAASALIVCSAAAQAEEYYGDSLDTAPSAEAMAFDLILVRPLGLVATAAGVGIFVLQLPISLFTWNLKDPAERLIVQPAKFTFTRDLGELD